MVLIDIQGLAEAMAAYDRREALREKRVRDALDLLKLPELQEREAEKALGDILWSLARWIAEDGAQGRYSEARAQLEELSQAALALHDALAHLGDGARRVLNMPGREGDQPIRGRVGWGALPVPVDAHMGGPAPYSRPRLSDPSPQAWDQWCEDSWASDWEIRTAALGKWAQLKASRMLEQSARSGQKSLRGYLDGTPRLNLAQVCVTFLGRCGLDLGLTRQLMRLLWEAETLTAPKADWEKDDAARARAWWDKVGPWLVENENPDRLRTVEIQRLIERGAAGVPSRRKPRGR